MNKFLEELADILELDIDELSNDFEYQESEEWDSLAQLSLITLLSDEYNLDVDNNELLQRKTVSQLLELLSQ